MNSTDSVPREIFGDNGKLFEARLKVYSKTGSVYTSIPKLALANGVFISVPDTITAESLVLQMNSVEGATANLGIKESDAVLKYLTLKAYKFPFINLLWLGTILMATGFTISMVRRIRVNKGKSDT